MDTKSFRTGLRPTTTKTEVTSGHKPVEGTIRTRWAGLIGPENVLPEFPRTQMVRSDWCNLNGLWDYAIRYKDESKPSAFTGKILVPFAIESALSGVKRRITPDDALWYRRSFEAAAPRDGRRTLLHFEAVDYQSTVSWYASRA